MSFYVYFPHSTKQTAGVLAETWEKHSLFFPLKLDLVYVFGDKKINKKGRKVVECKSCVLTKCFRMCLLNYAIYVFIMDLYSNNTHYFMMFSSVKHVCCMLCSRAVGGGSERTRRRYTVYKEQMEL